MASKARKTKKKRSYKGKAKVDQRLSVEQLLAQVGEKLDRFEYEEALGLCESALVLEPANVKVLETAAPILLELGQGEKAYEYLRAAVQLSPDSGYSKYMYLGQMCTGDEAITHLTKGVEIMTRLYFEQQATTEASLPAVEEVSAEKLSNGYCALAEIYLTDCCFLPEAEQKCLEYCTKAITFAPQNPDALQLMASFCLSKDDADGARSNLIKSLELWLSKQGTGDLSLPPYPSRVGCVKLLLEVEEMEKALCVLEGLLNEDDEVVEVWYLLGWTEYLMDDFGSARQHLVQAESLFHKVDCDDLGMLEHIQELLREPALHAPEQGEDGTNDSQPNDVDDDSTSEDSTNEMEVT